MSACSNNGKSFRSEGFNLYLTITMYAETLSSLERQERHV